MWDGLLVPEVSGRARPSGGAFRELVFELAEGRARLPHLRFLLERPAVALRVESVQASGDKVWEVARVTGPPGDLADLKRLVAEPSVPPVGAIDVVEEDARSLRWVVRWDRPADDGVPSLFHMVFDTAGPDALVTPLVRAGRIQIRVVCRCADELRGLYAKVEATYGRTWTVRLLRIGEPRSVALDMPEEDRQLLARALQAGYYDEPKRIGVRELGETLGWSKTVISRRLRALERLAVEQLASSE